MKDGVLPIAGEKSGPAYLTRPTTIHYFAVIHRGQGWSIIHRNAPLLLSFGDCSLLPRPGECLPRIRSDLSKISRSSTRPVDCRIGARACVQPVRTAGAPERDHHLDS